MEGRKERLMERRRKDEKKRWKERIRKKRL